MFYKKIEQPSCLDSVKRTKNNPIKICADFLAIRFRLAGSLVCLFESFVTLSRVIR